MVENALERPDLVQISVTSDTTIKVLPQEKYGITALPNKAYPEWDLDGVNTKLNRTEAHFIYARLNRADNKALIVFSVNDYDVDGSIGDGTASNEYYYIKIGSITATDSLSAPTVDREITFDYGQLLSDVYIDKGEYAEWKELFEVTLENLIRPLKRFASYIVEGTLSIIGKLVLNDKAVSDIARQGDQLTEEEEEQQRKNDEAVPTVAYLYGRYIEGFRDIFINKDREDQTEFLVKFLGGIVTDVINSTDFVTGMMGAGFCLKRNADGTTYMEVDKLLVRMKAFFQTLAIMETELAGPSFLFNSSGARIKIIKVELVERPVYLADGKAKYYADGKRAYVPPVYRCWFRNDDGEKTIENNFHVGNLARCQTFNIKPGVHENVSNRYWWRMVEAVGDDYIDVSTVHCDPDSDIPAVDDVVVQLGDVNDPDYQAAIMLSAFGDGAPYITFYQGINSYSMSGKDMFTIAYDKVNEECYIRNYGRFYTGDREQTNYVSYSRKDGLEIRAKKIYLGAQDLESEISGLKSSIEVLPDSITSIVEDATSGLRSEIKQTTDEISLSVNGITTDMAGVKTEMNGMNEEITYISTNLKKTGIDIAAGQITVTAPNFRVQNNMGEAIAVFTHDESGNPVIKATNIDVDNLYVRKLDGAEGSIGSLTISTDSTEGYIPGILYEYDNTILKLQPRWISPMPYNVFNRQPSAEQMNVLFYLKRRRSESRDRALYIDGVAEVYGRLGVGRGPDTGYAANYPAFVAEGVAVYGQFCLSYKRVTSSITLDINTVFYIVIAYNVTLTLPTSGLYDGMVYYIMNYTYANTVKIKGKIQMTTSTDATAEVDLTTDSRLAILIYSSQTDTWYYSQI